MSSSFSRGSVVYAGYDYTLRVTASSALFPSGVALTAQVRRSIEADEILATLTVGDGIARVDDNSIDFTIPGAATSDLTSGHVHVDFVRTDVEPDLHLQFRLKIPVVQPVTRGLA